VEHIVQDAGADDGTLDWLPSDPRDKAFEEHDDGMYDAVNRGFRRAIGEYFAYLNCDEQYLPEALRSVASYFQCWPDVDVLFAGGLVIDDRGRLVCYRKPLRPLKYQVMVDHLPVFTCATFIRRSAFAGTDLFDPRYRIVGDARWVLGILDRGRRIGILDTFTSAFTETGANLSLKPSPLAVKEWQDLFREAPAWARVGRRIIRCHHQFRKLLHGHYRQTPFSYSIYTRGGGSARTRFEVATPSGVWRSPGARNSGWLASLTRPDQR
jgi:glycosyltransferase involved in cell wall biosynthesis